MGNFVLRVLKLITAIQMSNNDMKIDLLLKKLQVLTFMAAEVRGRVLIIFLISQVARPLRNTFSLTAANKDL